MNSIAAGADMDYPWLDSSRKKRDYMSNYAIETLDFPTVRNDIDTEASVYLITVFSYSTESSYR